MPYGYHDADWEAAKREAKSVLAQRARLRGMMPYSELTSQMQSICFQPHDRAFFHFLGELSIEEAQAGRGMMTALVVHKDGDMQPGPGFFEAAQRLGLDTSDLVDCWVRELKKVHAAWAPQESDGPTSEDGVKET